MDGMQCLPAGSIDKEELGTFPMNISAMQKLSDINCMYHIAEAEEAEFRPSSMYIVRTY